MNIDAIPTLIDITRVLELCAFEFDQIKGAKINLHVNSASF